MRTSPLAVILAVCVLTAVAGGQAKPGDYLIGNQSGTLGTSILATTPGTNILKTVATFPSNQNLRGVVMGPTNADYYAAASLSVYKVTATGQVTTIVTTLPQGAGSCWAELDETGELLVGTGWAGNGGLFRLTTQGTLLTLMIPNTFPNVFCLDRDTGDIVVGESGGRVILRIRRDGTVTTLTKSPGTPYAMDFNPATGEILLGSSGALYSILRNGQVKSFASVPLSVKAIAVEATGNIVVGANGGSALLRYDTSGRLIGTVFGRTKLANVCMAIAGEHNLWGLNAPIPGGAFSMSVRFANHPGYGYVVAASFAPRPGFTIKGTHIPLNVDNLFAASASLPHIFVNFRGLLDTQGRAFPHVALPRMAQLKGTRIFFAAVVVDPKAPSGIGGVSQEYGVTIQ